MDKNHEGRRKCFKKSSQVASNANENLHDPKPSTSKSSKEKRNRRNFKEKLKILKELESSSISKISKKYGINARLLRKWRKKESEIVDFAQKLNLQKAKQKPQTNELDDAVYYWLLDAIAKGITVTGPIIQQKALSLNKDLNGSPDFRASDGWLRKWKIRKNVRSLEISGRSILNFEMVMRIIQFIQKNRKLSRKMPEPPIFRIRRRIFHFLLQLI